MEKIDLVLKKHDRGYYFSNPKTDSENEIFYDKLEGVMILVEYLGAGLTTPKVITKLFKSVIGLRYFPITKECGGEQLNYDIQALLVIKKFRDFLAEVSKLENEDNLPKFKAYHEENISGRIIGEEFISGEFYDKATAYEVLEELFGKGKIDKREKEKIQAEIESSALPVIEIDPALN